MKRQILKSFMALCAGVMTLCATSFFTSCERLNVLEQDMEDLKGQIEGIDTRLQAVEELKAKLEALTARVDALYTLKFQMTDGGELQYSFDGGQTWKGTEIILASQTTMKFKVSDKNELMYSEDNGSTWKSSGITLANECKKALQFKVENGKVLYTLDGTKWEETGATVVDPCENPVVEFVDNEDGTVTIKIGEGAIVINKPEEIVFEIKAGKVYFASEATQTVSLKTSGIEDLTVMSAPKGWFAEINSDGQIEVTAPNIDDVTTYYWTGEVDHQGTASATGYVKVHACSENGNCLVGKLLVEVSENQVILKAYNGKYHITTTDVNSYGVFFGIAPKDSYQEAAKPLIDAMVATANGDWESANDWEYKTEYPEESGVAPYAEGKMADILGYEPKVGEEYVIYAIEPNDSETTYSIDDLILAYYTPINVTVVEDETKRSAYDNYVTVTVDGASSYYAMIVPAALMDNINNAKEGMLDVENGSQGKLYNKNYEGSLYMITEGTEAYVGEGAPGTEGILLILPVDGRPYDEYSEDDIKEFAFTCGDLVAGGLANAAGELLPYDNEWCPYNQYTALGVKLEVPTVDWKYFYYMWMTEEQYGTGDDEALVDAVLADQKPMWVWAYPVEPWYVEQETGYGAYPWMNVNESADEVMYFVGFFVDDNGKYGTLVKIKGETSSLEHGNITLDPATNLNGSVLKSKTTLEVTLNPSETALKYKYYWAELYPDYDDFDEYTDSKWVKALDQDAINVQTVEPADLDEGKLVITDHYYGSDYRLVILPYDADGKPGKSVEVIEYECAYVIDAFETSNFVSEPTVVYNVPELMWLQNKYMTENNIGSVWDYDLENYYSYGDYGVNGISVNYSGSYTVTSPDGVEILTYWADLEDHPMAKMTAKERAEALWGESVYPETTTTTGTYSAEAYGVTPQNLLLVSWKVGETYYYKEIDPTTQLQALYNKLLTAANTAHPDGLQLTLPVAADSDWADMMEIPVNNLVLDLGVSKEGHMELGFDMWAAYGIPADTPVSPGMPPKAHMGTLGMGVLGVPYVVVPSSATEGVIRMFKASMTGTGYTDIPYSGYSNNQTAFSIDATAMMLGTVTATPVSENVTFYDPTEVEGGEDEL